MRQPQAPGGDDRIGAASVSRAASETTRAGPTHCAACGEFSRQTARRKTRLVKTIDLEIRGMHCAGCVATVEGALRKTPGVSEASVNLATERATLTVSDDADVRMNEILEAVAKAGYQASVAKKDADPSQRGVERARELASQQRRLIIAALVASPLLIGHFVGVGHATSGLWASLLPGINALLTAIVLVIAAGPILASAGRAALSLRGNMDLLVSLGALTAFFAGIVGWLTGRHELLMFDAAALVVLFVALGKHLEARARGQASAALEALAARTPRDALQIVGDKLVPTPVASLRPGQQVRVAAGQMIPLDGEITQGVVTVDESMLTGESRAITRQSGDRVLGGTRVIDGAADARVTAIGAESTVARIARLVEQAQSIKPPWQRLADRLAAWFTPVVLLLAFATFAGWRWGAQADLLTALTRAITTLVVACPCAMGLAIPTAVLVGTSRAAERGVLVRDPSALEAAGRVQEVFLDKTGTLTLGRPTLSRIDTAKGLDESEPIRLAASVEQLSDHPLAKAIVAAARQRGLTLSAAEGYSRQAGMGAVGIVEGRRVVVGALEWLREQGVSEAEIGAWPLDAEAESETWVALDGRIAARLSLADELHADAQAAVTGLKELGARTRIISGDRRATVARVAAQVGVESFDAELKPDDKLARLREAQQRGRIVAMVGDGINDAPALAAADVGIAIGAGADVAREAAPILLVGHSPLLIPAAIKISRASAAVMKQNLVWALAYNVVMLPLAMLAPISPALGAAAMMFSSLTVVGNSLRLRRLL